MDRYEPVLHETKEWLLLKARTLTGTRGNNRPMPWTFWDITCTHGGCQHHAVGEACVALERRSARCAKRPRGTGTGEWTEPVEQPPVPVGAEGLEPPATCL